MPAARSRDTNPGAGRLPLTGGRDDPDRVRSFVRSALAGVVPDDVGDDVELLAGELVAQALRDPVRAEEVRLEATGDRVRIEVTYGDTAAGAASADPPGGDQVPIRFPTGLVGEWHAEMAPAGDTLSFELDVRHFAAGPSGLHAGDPVEVRIGYTGDWASGFEIAAVVPGGYQVRRTSDRYLLPAPTGRGDIRRVR